MQMDQRSPKYVHQNQLRLYPSHCVSLSLSVCLSVCLPASVFLCLCCQHLRSKHGNFCFTQFNRTIRIMPHHIYYNIAIFSGYMLVSYLRVFLKLLIECKCMFVYRPTYKLPLKMQSMYA